MGNKGHLEVLREGTAVWNQWRKAERVANPDLSGFQLDGTDLRHADLHGVSFEGSSLHHAVLYRANAQNAVFKRANLRRANLVAADLNHSNLIGADLREADLLKATLARSDLRFARLRKAYLGDTDLSNANCESADMTWARLYGTIVAGASFKAVKFGRTVLADVDFSVCAGLEHIDHQDVSSLGLDTLSRSGRVLPVAFLRACGISEEQQGALLSATSSAMLQSCFISYAEADREFAYRLRDALNARGIDYWFAPDNGTWGRDLSSQLTEAIGSRDRVILICSRNSLSASDWVHYELTRTIEVEDERKKQGQRNWRTVFPVAIDDALLTWDHKFRPRLTEILIADFSAVARDTGPGFQQAVDRLVDGLKVVPARPR